MTADVIQTEPAALSPSWVLGAVLRVFGRRWRELLALGVLFVIAPEAVVEQTPPEAAAALGSVVGLVALIFIGGASLIAHAELTGGAIGVGAALRRAGSRFLSLLAINVRIGLGVVLGVLLLVVPGLILLVAWIPATAAMMVEESLPAAALGRAWRLTRGSRWRISGLSLLVLIALLALTGVALALDLALALTTGPALADVVFRTVVAPVWGFAITALMTVFSTAIYVGLRFAKEGVAAPVAEVFA